MRNIHSEIIALGETIKYLKAGIDLRRIQKLPGYKSLKTTEIFTHISKKDLGRIVSPLDRIRKGGRDGQ